ncbi:RNA polymerase sigma factor [Planctomycetota bacterium]
MEHSDSQFDSSDPIKVVMAWQRPMYGLAYRMLGNEADAMDATQEIFVKVLTKLRQYSHTGSFKAWIYQVGTRVVLDFIRSRKRRELREEAVAMEMNKFNEDKTLEQKELETIVQSRITFLPEELRSVLTLYYYQDLTQVEMAEVLQVPRTTIQTRLQQALDSLKSGLRGVGGFAVIPNIENVMRTSALPSVPSKLNALLMSMAAKAASGTALATGLTVGGIIMTKNIIITAVIASIVLLSTGFGIGKFTNHSAGENESLSLASSESKDKDFVALEKQIKTISSNHDILIQENEAIHKKYETLLAEKTEMDIALQKQQQENNALLAQLATDRAAPKNTSQPDTDDMDEEDKFVASVNWDALRRMIIMSNRMDDKDLSPEERKELEKQGEAMQAEFMAEWAKIMGYCGLMTGQNTFYKHPKVVIKFLEISTTGPQRALTADEQAEIMKASNIMTKNIDRIDQMADATFIKRNALKAQTAFEQTQGIISTLGPDIDSSITLDMFVICYDVYFQYFLSADRAANKALCLKHWQEDFDLDESQVNQIAGLLDDYFLEIDDIPNRLRRKLPYNIVDWFLGEGRTVSQDKRNCVRVTYKPAPDWGEAEKRSFMLVGIYKDLLYLEALAQLQNNMRPMLSSEQWEIVKKQKDINCYLLEQK